MDVQLFDGKTMLDIGIQLVLMGVVYGRLYTQVREVTKWKESRENDPLNVQLQNGLVKQAEVFERFNEHFQRLDEQVKGLMKEPIELALSRFEKRLDGEIRTTFADRESIGHQFATVKETIRQLDHRVTRDAQHITMILDKIFDNKLTKTGDQKLL